jgi:hypothetical protein
LSYFKTALLLSYVPIARLKVCSSNSIGDGPVSFKCNRESRGKPFIVTQIVDQAALPLCSYTIEEQHSDFVVGSILTHINEACICTSTEISVRSLLNGEVVSVQYVNSLEEWQVVKTGGEKKRKLTSTCKQRDSLPSGLEHQTLDTPEIQTKEQLSLHLHGFYAKGWLRCH